MRERVTFFSHESRHLGCTSTHNNTLHVLHENNWAPDLLSVLPSKEQNTRLPIRR